MQEWSGSSMLFFAGAFGLEAAGAFGLEAAQQCRASQTRPWTILQFCVSRGARYPGKLKPMDREKFH